MNSKRVKRLNKTIEFYRINFGFNPPYKILIDGTFCAAALEAKINIKEQLPKYLDSDVNIVTTQCIIMEVEKLSKIAKSLYGTWLIVKQFKVHSCGHRDDLKSATECIKSLLEKKNPTRYLLATVDESLREYARKRVFAAPIIFLHGQTPIIEKPPKETIEYLETVDRNDNYEMKALKEIKTQVLGEEEKIVKKRKRNHEPNPLSCLKSRKEKISVEPNPKSRRRRKKQTKEEDILTSIKKVFATDSKL